MLFGALNLTVLVLGTAVALCLLKIILGYERRENLTGFIIASSAVLVLNIAAYIFIKDNDTAGLITELSLSASIMGLPYFLLKPKKRLTFVWFGLIVCSTFDYFESLIIFFMKKPSEIYGQIIYIVLYSAALILIFVLHKIIKFRAPPDFLEQLSPVLGAVIFLADYTAYYDVMLNRDSAYYAEVSVVLKIVSTSLIVGCFSYIAYLCSSYSRKQKEAELQLEAELNHYEEMVRKNEDIRTFRHDYRNNLYSIRALSCARKTDEVVSFVDGLERELSFSVNRYKTGNYLADAIISGKAEQAERSGVTIEFSGIIPDKGIANNDLCAILSNAVDNAVRACSKIAPCTVKINSEPTANGVRIIISNPVKENVQIKNNTVKTSKGDKINHGFGLANIKKAVKNYDGYVELKCENKEFSIEIGLVLKKQEGVKNE